MKAIVTTKYGSPDVVQLQEVEKPILKDNEVLIRVQAAVVGPADCAFRKGDPFMIKLMYGLNKPKYPIQGAELSGEVEAVGSAVTLFKQGDPVYGLSPNTFGAHAEYMTLPESAPLVEKSAKMTDQDAVAIADGGLTALTFLREVAKVQPGQKVLINGASGAVGAYAVQLAKHFGAEVTGVCSTANVAMVKSFGADHVIDYTKSDFTRSGQTYDVVFDAVGKRSYAQCSRSLAKNGIYLTTVPTLSIVFAMLWTSLRTRLGGGKRAKFVPAGLMQKKENLVFLNKLFEAGQIRSVIDRCYPLPQIAEAYRYVETGRKKGNVVIKVGADSSERSQAE